MMKLSHPSRDAWIEIHWMMILLESLVCRIPRGMRGLKSDAVVVLKYIMLVASLAGCVD